MRERAMVDRQRRTGKVSGSPHGRILQIALLHIFGNHSVGLCSCGIMT
jgi:hypothetical protein